MRKRHFLRTASVVLALLGSTQLARAQSTESVGSITSAANSGTDQSMALLKSVFGGVISNPINGGGSASAIGQVFATLNACILVVGALWACYLFVAAMIATGSEGEFMGQKRSSIWFTIRNGVGFSLLVPLPLGYSGAQLLMLWATMMGIGIANLDVATATSVLANGGALIASPPAPQVTNLAKSMFEANLCAQSANLAANSLTGDTGGVTADAGEQFNTQSTTGQVVLMNGNGLSCGGASVSLTLNSNITGDSVSTSGFTAIVPDVSGVVSTMQSAQQSALSSMQATLQSAAATYVQAVASGSHPADPQITINNAAQAYQQSIQGAIAGASSSISGLSSQIQSSLSQNGWIMLGSWYQTFAMANTQLTSSTSTAATAIPPTDPANLPYPDLYNNVLVTYHHQLAQDASTTVAGSSSSSSGSTNLSSISSDPGHVLSGLFPGQRLVNLVTTSIQNIGTGTGTNPLIGMKNVGDYILDAGDVMLAAYVANSAFEGATGSGIGWVADKALDVVTLGASDSVKGALQQVIKDLSPIIMLLLLSLFFFGVMLSVYLPMLPFMIWFGGILSWFAVVCEAVIAAPLWAFAHLDGEGEGMGPRTLYGYVFLLNLMLRPAFMVIGFLIASIGIVAFGTLLNSLFGTALANAQFNSTTGIVSIIAYIALYVGMCQSLCQALFGMVNHLPNTVFAWLGASMGNTVGHDMHDKSHGHLGAASGTTRGHVDRALGRAGGDTSASPGGDRIGPAGSDRPLG
ncbi:DotA/TraY family protein [Paraburkholderia acidiphila]|uniref:DotA/TraY family protein n=1 Tax=Paraburkholderia acidiphila TaxID=2571747 RepID=A0A7Z2G4K3_9BURK|nr:DotA/TraY family protein [Paraburkholderia acidiphila]QGZ55108.1 DotA/TraY family protein [Paraburkholderia acidiphila]